MHLFTFRSLYILLFFLYFLLFFSFVCVAFAIRVGDHLQESGSRQSVDFLGGCTKLPLDQKVGLRSLWSQRFVYVKKEGSTGDLQPDSNGGHML